MVLIYLFRLITPFSQLLLLVFAGISIGIDGALIFSNPFISLGDELIVMEKNKKNDVKQSEMREKARR